MFSKIKKIGSLTLATIILISSLSLSKIELNVKAAGATDYKNMTALIEKTIGEEIKKSDSSASISIMDAGNVVYSKDFGLADREKNQRAESNTRFNIGSVSKTFCAVAIMCLVDEGKLSLDDKVYEKLPEFIMADERYKDITVRMLLNHTSGFSSGLPSVGFNYCYIESDNKGTFLKALKNSSLKFKPGEVAIYDNTAFALAEILIEKLAGENYMEFLKQKIFVPLDMQNTGVSVGEYYTNGGKNIAHYYDENGNLCPPESVYPYAAGGLSSTSEDLCKFGKSFCNDSTTQILSNKSLSEMKKIQPSEIDSELNVETTFGLGWDSVNYRKYKKQNLPMLEKAGGLFQFSAQLIVLPEQSIVVSLCRTLGDPTIAFTVLNALLKDKGYKISTPEWEPGDKKNIPDEIKNNYKGIYIDGASTAQR